MIERLLVHHATGADCRPFVWPSQRFTGALWVTGGTLTVQNTIFENIHVSSPLWFVFGGAIAVTGTGHVDLHGVTFRNTSVTSGNQLAWGENRSTFLELTYPTSCAVACVLLLAADMISSM